MAIRCALIARRIRILMRIPRSYSWIKSKAIVYKADIQLDDDGFVHVDDADALPAAGGAAV